MKKRGVQFLILSGVTLVILVVGFTSRTKAQMPPTNSARTPVLIELFTSEGCSSCPPADALLQKLLRQQGVEAAEIIALEEHVDYWNHLGWGDPFSSPAWTERQQDYSSSFGNDPYTPELVVDGRSNFVGSNAREAESEIAKAARIPKTTVAINLSPADSQGGLSVSISVGKLPARRSKKDTSNEDKDNKDDAEVWLAVTEDGLHSNVNAGENQGRALNHVATLRSLRKIGVAQTGDAANSYAATSPIKIKPEWKAENLHVVVFVQQKHSRQILGAASFPLGKS